MIRGIVDASDIVIPAQARLHKQDIEANIRAANGSNGRQRELRVIPAASSAPTWVPAFAGTTATSDVLTSNKLKMCATSVVYINLTIFHTGGARRLLFCERLPRPRDWEADGCRSSTRGRIANFGKARHSGAIAGCVGDATRNPVFRPNGAKAG
ncbi:MAG: hypothetical protein ACREPU_03750, partial [Rhodanobacteraceae bacterium]